MISRRYPHLDTPKRSYQIEAKVRNWRLPLSLNRDDNRHHHSSRRFLS
jgi:hypothetical protein